MREVTIAQASTWERIPLRLIGLGVILLANDTFTNLVRYFGVYWKVGAWALAERPIALHTIYRAMPDTRTARDGRTEKKDDPL